MKVSKDEALVAVESNVSPEIFLIAPNLRERKDVGKIVGKVTSHKEQVIQMLWGGKEGTTLFSADRAGAVFKTTFNPRVTMILGADPEFITQCDRFFLN